MYTPQPIAVHTLQQRQNFRRGSCAAYDNPVLRSAPNFIFPAVMIKRLTSGEAPTVKLYRLTDDFISTLTPASAVNWPLDNLGEFEMLVLGFGNWTGIVPSDIIGAQCYLKIETASADYYTDEFFIMADTSGFPPDCGENWVKLTWTLNGQCIVSGKTNANEAEPVHAYPITPIVHMLYLNADLSRPEWEYDQTDDPPDAHGIEVANTKRLVKRWTLEGYPVTESVTDAITSAALSDSVAIEFADGTVFQDITDIKTEVNWELGGCLATYKMKFTTDYLVKQGCC